MTMTSVPSLHLVYFKRRCGKTCMRKSVSLSGSAAKLWVGKWVVIHVITWITGAETIKRQTRVAYGWSVVGQSVLAGWHGQRRCSCGMRLVALYKCYMPFAFAVAEWSAYSSVTGVARLEAFIRRYKRRGYCDSVIYSMIFTIIVLIVHSQTAIMFYTHSQNTKLNPCTTSDSAVIQKHRFLDRFIRRSRRLCSIAVQKFLLKPTRVAIPTLTFYFIS